MDDYRELYLNLVKDVGKAIEYLEKIHNKSLDDYIKNTPINEVDEKELDLFGEKQ